MTNVFVHEFTNAFGKWRIELFRPPSGFGVPFNFVDLPPAAIPNVNGINWEYDNLPIGAPTAPELEFIVNADYAAQDAEFRSLVYRPAFYRNVMFFGATFKVLFGTTLKLYHYNKYGVPKWLWTGVVRTYDYSQKDRTIKCTAYDANRVCLESTNFDGIHEFARSRQVMLSRSIELQFGDGTTQFELRASNGIANFAYLYEVWDYIARAGRTIKSYILGLNSDDPEELGFNFTGGEFMPFKQSRTARNGLGASITANDVLVISEIDYNGLGLFLDRKEGLPGRYKSAYDLISEMSEQLFTRLSAWGSPRLTPFFMAGLTRELDPARVSITAKDSMTGIVKSTGSHIERSGGKDCEDVDKCEVEIGGASRNNGDKTTPIVWSNIPPNCSTTEKGAGRNVQQGLFLYGLYYVDQVGGEDVAVKIHHVVDVPVSNAKKISDLPGCAFRLPDLVEAGTKRAEFAYPRVTQNVIQVESGWGNIAARADIALFGEPEAGPATELEIEIPGGYASELMSDIFSQTVLYLPPDALGVFATPGTGLFIPISNEFDFDEGVLKIKLFEVPQNAV